MTVHNAIKYAPLVQRAAAAATGLAGEESGLERVGESLTPVFDLWTLPEWAFLRGERLCGWSRFVPAGGAATFAGVALCNTTPNILCVVEAVSVQIAGASPVQLWMALDADVQASFPASSQGASRDRRNPGTTSLAVVRYGSPAATPTAAPLETRTIAVAETMDLVAPPIVLATGQCCFVQTTIANIALFANFKWRERRLFPSEQARG